MPNLHFLAYYTSDPNPVRTTKLNSLINENTVTKQIQYIYLNIVVKTKKQPLAFSNFKKSIKGLSINILV